MTDFPTELPKGYRWATADETEEMSATGDFSRAVQVRQGGTDEEPQTDLAVPVEKSRVFGMWYGGASYSDGNPKDLEWFKDLEEAKEALLDRYSSGHWREQVFQYVHKERAEVRTPAVDESTQMLVFLSDPTHSSDPYPDRVLSLEFSDDDDAVVVDSPA